MDIEEYRILSSLSHRTALRIYCAKSIECILAFLLFLSSRATKSYKAEGLTIPTFTIAVTCFITSTLRGTRHARGFPQTCYKLFLAARHHIKDELSQLSSVISRASRLLRAKMEVTRIVYVSALTHPSIQVLS